MNIIKQLILSFMSTIGFSVLFSSPKENLIYAGIAGSMGWTIYYITANLLHSNIIGTFFGAITVGLLGELLARLCKKPATIYITSGIVPLVPGAGMYYTMLAIIENDFNLAANKGVETFFIAITIAIGIIISSGFSKSIKRVKQKD
ncbi:threonine/serine exporter family protein [Tissierella praeacuta]|uniref:Uncharacterized membrane protein YjjB, DUF3815 family n=1 Tax=Tissierella praeacuta DSM 18095 TaxID=1123404 RepID=A0A1M4ZDQ6_9FIRM|nr:threonine/serine exporter family protein [Tissierella praeacuta]MBU5257410.1 threonine/serine exporter family protein [Tissierella praeacuta]TCU65384.1 uncharacterized membrane protein YjjB (DUF3815 family) [Tissierella praeacuta]SHF16189.1 Uncharacterized membrane protein YjjB, DUF3815 family [Tissierella praeacuta DSM 18095]SUP01897.1 Uncharacterized conserved protein [Tissierella praeacuta]